MRKVEDPFKQLEVSLGSHEDALGMELEPRWQRFHGNVSPMSSVSQAAHRHRSEHGRIRVLKIIVAILIGLPAGLLLYILVINAVAWSDPMRIEMQPSSDENEKVEQPISQETKTIDSQGLVYVLLFGLISILIAFIYGVLKVSGTVMMSTVISDQRPKAV